MRVDIRPFATPALWRSRAAIVIGWALILSGFGLFGWGCLMWLRDGIRHHASLADLWGHLPLGGDRALDGWHDMRGLHHQLFRVLRWFGRFPIGLALVVAGEAAARTGDAAHDRADRDLAPGARRSTARSADPHAGAACALRREPAQARRGRAVARANSRLAVSAQRGLPVTQAIQAASHAEAASGSGPAPIISPSRIASAAPGSKPDARQGVAGAGRRGSPVGTVGLG